MANIIATLDLIDTFAEFPRGWSYGEGVPASSISVAQIKDLVRFAYDSGIREFEAFPGLSGEVQVCFYIDDDTLEITAETGGLLTIVVEKQDEIVLRKENASFREGVKFIKEFAENKCHSYAPSTSESITIEKRSGYQVWLSDRPRTAASQSFSRNAFRTQVSNSVSISRDIILQELQETQSLSGKYQTNSFQNLAVAN